MFFLLAVFQPPPACMRSGPEYGGVPGNMLFSLFSFHATIPEKARNVNKTAMFMDGKRPDPGRPLMQASVFRMFFCRQFIDRGSRLLL